MPDCQAAVASRRAEPSANAEARLTAQRGYDARWQSLTRVQLAQQPFCAECGTTEDLTVDHVLPLARGGRSELSNVQTLCRSCNGIKEAT